MPSDLVRAALWIVSPLVGLAIFVGMAALEGSKGPKAAYALYFCGYPALAGLVAFLWEFNASGRLALALLSSMIWIVLASLLTVGIWFKSWFPMWVAQRRQARAKARQDDSAGKC